MHAHTPTVTFVKIVCVISYRIVIRFVVDIYCVGTEERQEEREVVCLMWKAANTRMRATKHVDGKHGIEEVWDYELTITSGKKNYIR